MNQLKNARDSNVEELEILGQAVDTVILCSFNFNHSSGITN